MKLLKLIAIACEQLYLRWAEWDMGPAHPDYPEVMLRREELAEQERAMFA